MSAPCTPDAVLNALDIAVDVDAVRELGFPCPASCSCVDEADLRADLDGDGDIDADDNALEATGVLYFVVNSDDDNGDGLEDYLNDGPVANEDDLVEIRMSAKCRAIDPNTAWWKISWTEPDPLNPALKVWLTPDKSNGQGAAGSPIPNNIPQDWPPPQSVWLEALHTFDDLDITLTITDNSVSAPTAGQGTKTTTLNVASPCKFGRKHAGGNKPAGWLPNEQEQVTGTQGSITTHEMVLCGEAIAKSNAASAAWVGCFKYAQGGAGTAPSKIAQIGYLRRRIEKEGGTITRGVYCETKSGPSTDFPDYQIRFFNFPDSGSHYYRCQLINATGAWEYFFGPDQNKLDRIHIPPEEMWGPWRADTCTVAAWSTEIWNEGDRMVGTAEDKCRFRECMYRAGAAEFKEAHLKLIHIDSSDPEKWGIEPVDPIGQDSNMTFEGFNVWDKRAP